MCKQSGSNTQTVVQNPTVPDWLSTKFQNLANTTETLGSTPFNTGTQRNVANFNQDQLASFQSTRDNQGIYQPYTDAATNFAAIGGSPITGQEIANYTNPFQQQVIDATLANIQQNNAIQANNLKGNAALQGGLMNDRLGVAQAELARNQNLATNQTLGTLAVNNYNQGLGAVQQDRTRAANAATQFNNLGQNLQAMSAQDASNLLLQGGVQQDLTQRQLDTTTANVAQQEQYPFALASFQSGIYQGASPSFTGYSQSTTQPQPSTLNTILGAGALGLGAYARSDERIKTDIAKIGEDELDRPLYRFRYKDDPSGQVHIGYIAQDVAQTNPEDVGMDADGNLIVNYQDLTDQAAAVGERDDYADGGFTIGGNYNVGRRRNESQGQQGSQPTQVGNQGPYAGGLGAVGTAQMMQAMNQPRRMPAPKMSTPSDTYNKAREVAADMKSSFDLGGDAVSAARRGLGAAASPTDKSGWNTTVTPESGEGTMNMWNRMGFYIGGRVPMAQVQGPYSSPDYNPAAPTLYGMPVPGPQVPVRAQPAGLGAIAPPSAIERGELPTPTPPQPAGPAGLGAVAPTTGWDATVTPADPNAVKPEQQGFGLPKPGFNPALGDALLAAAGPLASGTSIQQGLALGMTAGARGYQASIAAAEQRAREDKVEAARRTQEALQNRIAERKLEVLNEQWKQQQAEYADNRPLREAQIAKAQRDAAGLEGTIAERTRVADRIGLTGEERQRFILSGDAKGGGKVGLTPLFGVDKDNNPVVMQPTDSGRVVASQMPDGVRISREPIKMDAGTHFVLMDPVTRQVIGQIPKNNQQESADKARGQQVGEAQGKALVDLPKVESEAQSVLNYIKAVEEDPNLPNVLGYAGQIPFTVIPKNRTTLARVDQLKGKAFLSAFESLKGAGAITEVEGAKATAALARLNDTGQDEAGYRQALADFKMEVERLLANAQRRAKAAQSPSGAPKTNDGWSVEVVK